VRFGEGKGQNFIVLLSFLGGVVLVGNLEKGNNKLSPGDQGEGGCLLGKTGRDFRIPFKTAVHNRVQEGKVQRSLIETKIPDLQLGGGKADIERRSGTEWERSKEKDQITKRVEKGAVKRG